MKACEVKIQYKNTKSKDTRQVIKTKYDAYRVIKPYFKESMDYRECAYLMLLNTANEVLGVSELSKGGIQSTIMDVRMVGQLSLLSNATNIIIVHNHPSGTLKASDSDVKFSKRILESMRLFDIELLDSLIVSSEGCYSLKEDNLF